MTKFSALGLLIGALVATTAQAELPPPQQQVIVRTADLDLGSSAGRHVLDHRLVQAVNHACGVASDADLAGSNEVRRCRKSTHSFFAEKRNRLVEMAGRAAVIAVTAAR